MQYAQYLVVFVCLSVCLPTLIPALQATRCNMSGASSFRLHMRVIPEMTSESSCISALALPLPGFVRMMLLRGCVSITLKATN